MCALMSNQTVYYERIRMKKSVLLLLLTVPVLLAATVEVGSAGFGSTKPFCGN